MVKIKYILLLLCLVILGCGKDNDDELPNVDSDIVGKWQLEATRISPGGIVDWSNIANGEIYDFLDNGTFQLSNSKECDMTSIGTYSLKEDNLALEFLCDSETRKPNYFFWFNEGKLVLGFIGCIEGCSYRFKKIN